MEIFVILFSSSPDMEKKATIHQHQHGDDDAVVLWLF